MQVFLKSLTIRKYEKFSVPETIAFSDRHNLIIGANGAGKTQLLWLLGAICNLDFSNLIKQNKEFDVSFELNFIKSKDVMVRLLCKCIYMRQSNSDSENMVIKHNESPLTPVEKYEFSGKMDMNRSDQQPDLSYSFMISGNKVESVNTVPNSPEKSFQTSFIGDLSQVLQEIFNHIGLPADYRTDRDWWLGNFKYRTFKAIRLSETDDEFQQLIKDIAFSITKPTNEYPAISIKNARYASSIFALYVFYAVDADFQEYISGKVFMDNNPVGSIFPVRFRDILDAINAKSLIVRFRLSKETEGDGRKEFDFSAIDFTIEYKAGGTYAGDSLTFGQRRYLTHAIISDIRAGFPTIVDEISNGYHPHLLSDMVKIINDKQSFISSHNPLVIDYIPVNSSKDIVEKINVCIRDKEGVQLIRKLTMPEAEKIYDKIDVGLMKTSDVLYASGVW